MKKRISLLVMLLVLMASTTVFAGTSTYSGVILPAFQGDRELAEKTKTTDEDQFAHQLTGMGGTYDKVNVWLETPGGTNLTNHVTHQLGNPSYTVYYKSGQDKSAGDQVVLNLENYVNIAQQVEVFGNYDYK